jgi:hypothetical protein
MSKAGKIMTGSVRRRPFARSAAARPTFVLTDFKAAEA